MTRISWARRESNAWYASAAGRLLERNQLDIYRLRNLDAIVKDGHHEAAVVFHHRRLTRRVLKEWDFAHPSPLSRIVRFHLRFAASSLAPGSFGET